jgi:hypothetical protein
MASIRIIVIIGIAGALLAAAGAVLAIVALTSAPPAAAAVAITRGATLVLQDSSWHAVLIREGGGTGMELGTLAVAFAGGGSALLLGASAVALRGITRLRRDTAGLV